MYTKLLFIIAGFSLFLTGCSRPKMESDSLDKAECIKGVYSGTSDFQRARVGGRSYRLEVNHNSNEIIFLLTNTDEGSQVCTTYQNPSFSATEENEFLFNLESDAVENNGVIYDTTGVFSIVVSSIPQEEGAEESVLCDINQLKLYREGDDMDSSSFTTLNSPIDTPTTEEEVEIRSFDELKSECDAPGERATVEQEVADNSDSLEGVDLQDPTQ